MGTKGPQPVVGRRPPDELTPDEREFAQAIDRYKAKFNRPFPSWPEILEVLKSLGYRKG